MPNYAKGMFKIQMGDSPLDSELLTDNGDQKRFNSSVFFLSNRQDESDNDFSPVVVDNGIVSGAVVTPGASNDTVSVTSSKCNLNGVKEKAVSEDTALSLTRGAGASTAYIINSITVDNTGTYVVVVGAGGTAHVSTRGAAGGPPSIALDSVEVAQVHFTSETAGLVTTSEIRSTPGTHTELANFPSYKIIYGRAKLGILEYAGIEFDSALPKIHTGSLPKRTYLSGYTPVFSELSGARDVILPTMTGSTTSEAVYSGVRTATDQSIGDGSFSYMPTDPVLDSIGKFVGQMVWMQLYQDRAKAPYKACLGRIFESPTAPATGLQEDSWTISPEMASFRVNG